MGDSVSTDEVRIAVIEWFGHVGAASLKLPSGWFARPHDNLHRLTSAHVVAGRLVVALDGQGVLTLAHPTSASVAGTALVISGFHHGTWDWDEYGSNKPHLDTFQGGAVEFVA
jgi:hypothetical protein